MSCVWLASLTSAIEVELLPSLTEGDGLLCSLASLSASLFPGRRTLNRCPVDVPCRSGIMEGTNGNPDAFGDGHIAGVLPVESQDSNSRLTVTEYL